MNILVNVINQKLKVKTNTKKLVSGTQKFIRFEFNLDNAWNDLLVFAQFVQNGKAYNDYLDENNCVYLPPEIAAGKFIVLLYGSGSNVIATTNYLTFEVDKNMLVSDAQSTEITESLYNKLVNIVKTYASQSASGAPTPVPSSSLMTDPKTIYLYTGSEDNFIKGDWYYFSNGELQHGGTYGVGVTDGSLTIEGAAADAKVVGDALVSKIAKPLTSPNGTNGQLLRTNGDGTTQWVDEGLPTDEQTETAVNAWLDEHPEATTTVQDGAVTWAKLNDSVQEEIDRKAPAIMADSEQEYTHTGLTFADKITFIGNPYAFDTAKHANRPNLFPDISAFDYEANGVDVQRKGRFLLLNGTPTKTGTSTAYAKAENDITPGSYKLIVKFHVGNSVVSQEKHKFLIQIEDKDCQYRVFAHQDVTYQYDISIEQASPKILVGLGTVVGDVYDGFAVWYALYASDVTIVDTDHIVNNGETYVYEASISEQVVDTGQHQSVLEVLTDTKEYIDNHVPADVVTDKDLIYVSPEMFGAAGDGVADDTTAINNCLSYASEHGKPVRGYGEYKITDAVVLNSQYLNVYLKKIAYSGSNNAVEILHKNIKFEFDTIKSNSVGIHFGKNTQADYYARDCQVIGNAIYSAADCILARSKTLYNVCEIKLLSSTNANCAKAYVIDDEFGASEYVFENSQCHCPNGYVAYEFVSSKFYNFTVESDCKFGLLNPIGCVCIGWRHAEQTDGIAIRVFNGVLDRTNGPLIIFTKSPSPSIMGVKFISSLALPWYAIDMSAIQNYDTVDTYDDWQTLAYTGVELGTPMRGAMSTSRVVFADKVYLIGGHKVFVPEKRSTAVIDVETCDFRLMEGQADEDIRSANLIIPYLVTDFIIGAPHTDIYFNASFGAVGYNDLTITQENGNTCTIYDKLGNILFDGTNLGDGKWHMKCVMNKSSNGRNTSTRINHWWCYDGTNEIWEITKLA